MSAEQIATTAGAGGRSRVGRAGKQAVQRNLWGYLFVAPAILGLIFWTIGPMVVSLGLSFTQWDMLSAPQWTGFSNFSRMLSGADPLFWQTVETP